MVRRLNIPQGDSPASRIKSVWALRTTMMAKKDWQVIFACHINLTAPGLNEPKCCKPPNIALWKKLWEINSMKFANNSAQMQRKTVHEERHGRPLPCLPA
jgi:hypothetical protein